MGYMVARRKGETFTVILQLNILFSSSHFLLTPTPPLPHLSLSLSPSSLFSSLLFSLFPFLRSYQQRIHHYRILRNEEGLLSIQV